MEKVKHLAIDSMVLIYLLEGQFLRPIKRALDTAERVTLSTLGMAEILTGFEKSGDEEGKLKFLSFLEAYKKLSVVGFGKQEALIFAELRAKYPRVKPPDAIHLATAISARADAFLTNDRELKGVEELRVELLAPM